jgi:hypothetical protein
VSRRVSIFRSTLARPTVLRSGELREKGSGWDDAGIAAREAIRLDEGQVGDHLKAVLGADLLAKMRERGAE